MEGSDLKKYGFWALLLALCILAGLLGGCAQEAPAAPAETAGNAADAPAAVTEESEAADAAPAALPVPAPDFAEPDGIDDSAAFAYHREDYGGDALGLTRYLEERFYPEHLAQYLDGVEILDSGILSNQNRGSAYGWICFAGTPKTDTGWQTVDYEGREAYCRSVYAESADGVNYTLAKSYAMLPVPYMSLYPNGALVTGEDGGMQFPDSRDPILSGLTGAELYVPDSGETAAITDPAALTALAGALNECALYYNFSAAPGAGCFHGVIPLYLHFENGDTTLALAAADGSDSVFIWDGWRAYSTGRSLFELMSLDHPAAGYTRNADGSVTALVSQRIDPALPAGLLNNVDFSFTYDAYGVRIRDSILYHERPGDREAVSLYEYDEEGRPIRRSVSTDGHLDVVYTWEYDAQGRLSRTNMDLGEGDERSHYNEFVYDELGRLTAVIWHNLDGSEGLPTGNTYYWYDDEGVRHTYGFDSDGNLVGPEGEDRPVRRG